MISYTEAIVLVVTALALRFGLPWIAYYASKAAAMGWLQGHNTFYNTFNESEDDDVNGKSSTGGKKRQGIGEETGRRT